MACHVLKNAVAPGGTLGIHTRHSNLLTDQNELNEEGVKEGL